MNSEARLYKALRDFRGATNGNINSLDHEFETIAKAAFYSGYFIVNKGGDYEYKIRITNIEFYYHEDEGIQDPRKLLKGKNSFDYELGALYPHEYGVDVLFDDVEERYHASFLIREFAVEENGKPEYVITDHPRYLWDYLFGGANMLLGGRFAIEWCDDESVSDSSVEKAKVYKRARKFSKKTQQEGDDREWSYFIK